MTQEAGRSPAAVTTTERLGPEKLGFGPLFWAAHDAVIVCDVARNQVLFCNPAVERIYGYTSDELEGRPIDIFIPDNLKAAISAQSEGYLADLRAGARDLEARLKEPMEFPAVHKSGRELVVEFSVNPLNIPGEVFVFVIVRDVTERKRLQAERDALLADVQETLRQANKLAQLKADFTAMIAHEVGSPIAAVAAMVDLLEHDGLTPEKRAQITATIRSEIQLLQRLVDDVQSAASMDSGSFSVHMKPVPVTTLLSQVTAAAQTYLVHHDFRVEAAVDTSVLADCERIGQVLRNLLGNAAKYTPAGTAVTLRARPGNGRVHIDVIDEGPGIPPADMEHIFTKFGRGRDATGKRLPGMGLGLYLSRRIVEKHDSVLFATSEPGTGTTFSFDLKDVSS